MSDTGKLTVGSLFAGIGGFDLGLERTGAFETRWFCEVDPYCRRVLAKHWPNVQCHGDIAALDAGNVEPVDVLCGGFPCQDISLAGRGAGLSGARSGLWSEYARLVGELRPRYVIVENVPALRKRGLEVVLADLLACGYDAEWDGIPAAAVGAPHRRDRLWIVAYPIGEPLRLEPGRGSGPDGQGPPQPRLDGEARALAHPDCRGRNGRSGDEPEADGRGEPPNDSRPSFGHWTTEPDVGRVAHGVPARVDRLRALGNALVPQIAEWIGRRIADYEGVS